MSFHLMMATLLWWIISLVTYFESDENVVKCEENVVECEKNVVDKVENVIGSEENMVMSEENVVVFYLSRKSLDWIRLLLGR